MSSTMTRSNTVIRIAEEKPFVRHMATNSNALAELPKSDDDVPGHRISQEPANTTTSPPVQPSVVTHAIEISQKMDNPSDGQAAALDPISIQILKRTVSQHRVPGLVSATSPSNVAPPSPDDVQAITRQSTAFTDTDSLKRTDTLMSIKGTKEKKKGFLSRFLGNKNRDTTVDNGDNVSEMTDNREAGTHAEVFSQPIGFVPTFPAPPRYIRVKAQNRKKRDFDRLFLAQILSEGAPRSRNRSDQIDSKIHAIDDHPVVPPPNSTRIQNKAIWAAEFSRDGQYYAAGGQDRKLKVWRVISAREDRECSDDENSQNVKLNAPVFKQELVREYGGHSSAILDLSWSKNNFLLSSSMDKTVRLYHISRPECLCAFKHNDFVTSISFHPRDDRFFLAGSLDSKLRLWSIPDKNVAFWAQVPEMVTAVAFTPDGRTAIAGTLAGLCILYDTEGLKAHSQIHVRSNRGKNSKGSKITGIETIQLTRPNSPPDVKLLITSNDSRIRMYNLRDRSLEAKFRGNENSTSQIRASFSDDGKFVICGSEDKKVYIWSTDPVERQDSEKRPVEVFEAHNSIVTTALLLPAKSRKLLAQSGDPIYDVCNPPPVRLLSRTDSNLSYTAPTVSSEIVDEKAHSSIPTPPEDNPQYITRSSHNGGFVLVTGDYTGEIKVFRQDCAYQKRKDSSWDTVSFSKKMLARSGSVTTKTSDRSSIYRKSITFGDTRSPANRDSIINWRNSISVMSEKSPSVTTSTSEIAPSDVNASSRQNERDRSSSPGGFGKRSLAQRFSLRHGSTPLANSTQFSTDEPQRLSTPPNSHHERQRSSEATINPTSPSYYSASETSSRHRSSLPPVGAISVHPVQKNGIPNISLTTPSPVVGGDHTRSILSSEGPTSNGLFLEGDQSYMAYDVSNSLIPMANAQPRTPGPNVLRPDGPDRQTSFVSILSSERDSSASTSIAASNEHRNAGLGINRAGISDDEKSEGEELRCKTCGGESFRMVKSNHNEGITAGGSSLKCKRCGELV